MVLRLMINPQLMDCMILDKILYKLFNKLKFIKDQNGAHFGPDAIGGAINFVTDIDYTNSFSLSGFRF